MTTLWLLLNAAPARAQADDSTTRASARQLGTAGVEAYQAGSYVKASEKLEKAFRILKVPTLGLWSARALKATGRYVQAAERYLEVTRLEVSGGDVAVQKRAMVDAATELDGLRLKIPSLTIEVKGAPARDVAVELDGAAIASDLVGEAQPVNPGAHHIVVSHAGRRVTAEVTLGEGETKTTVLELAPTAPAVSGVTPGAEASTTTAGTGEAPSVDAAPARKGSTARTLAWISVGVGGAGLALGGVTGALALGKRGTIDQSQNCDGDRCLPSERDLADSYNSLRTISSVGFIAGGVLAATGVVLLLTAPGAEAPKDSGPSAALWLSPAGAVVRGRF